MSYVAARMGNSIDSSSYGNIEEIKTDKLHLNLTVDFNTETFTGYAVHELVAV